MTRKAIGATLAAVRGRKLVALGAFLWVVLGLFDLLGSLFMFCIAAVFLGVAWWFLWALVDWVSCRVFWKDRVLSDKLPVMFRPWTGEWMVNQWGFSLPASGVATGPIMWGAMALLVTGFAAMGWELVVFLGGKLWLLLP